VAKEADGARTHRGIHSVAPDGVPQRALAHDPCRRREKLEQWLRHYNENRPHSTTESNVPIAMHYPDGVTSPSS